MKTKDKIVTVIAGPNGAGKTSLQSLLRQAHLVKCYLERGIIKYLNPNIDICLLEKRLPKIISAIKK